LRKSSVAVSGAQEILLADPARAAHGAAAAAVVVDRGAADHGPDRAGFFDLDIGF
jgi:hypothetical protein